MESRTSTACQLMRSMIDLVDGVSTESESSDDDDTETQETKALAWLTKLEDCKKHFEADPDRWESLETYKTLVRDMEIYHPKDRITAKCDTFVEMKDVLGPFLGCLVRALSVQIKNKHMLKGRSIQTSGKLRLSSGRLVAEDWQGVEHWRRKRWTQPELGHEGPLALEEVAPRYQKNIGSGWFFSDPSHVRVHIYWCGLPFSGDMVGFLRFIVALGDSSAPDIFESPLAQVMCQVAWKWNLGIYIFRRVVDVMTVMLLVFIGLHSRISHGEEARHLNLMVRILFTGTNLINLAWCVLTVSSCFQVFDTVRPIMRSTLLLHWGFELSMFFVCIRLVLDADNFIQGHPVLIASAIVIKWMQFQLRMMGFDIFIDFVLPCWSSLTSTASLSFLFYMTASILGAVFAYFSLPRRNWESSQLFPGWDDFGAYRNDFAHAVVATAQLTLLSTFNMNAIEGTKTGYKLENTTVGHRFSPEITDTVKSMHYALPFLVLPNAFLFAVLVLNLYIGILSDEYSKAKENLLQLKCRHRILVSLPNLLVLYVLGNHGFKRLFRSASIFIDDHVNFKRCKTNSVHGFHAAEGFWFAVPAGPGDDNGQR